MLKFPRITIPSWAWLSAGSGAALIINFISLPFLARFYAPESYGLFAILLVAALGIAGVGSLCYEQAIPLPARARDAFALGLISVGLAVLAGMVLMGLGVCIVLLQGAWIPDLRHALLLGLLVPLAVSTQVFTLMLIRWRRHRTVGMGRLFQAVVTLGMSLCLAHYQSFGLLFGFAAGQMAALIVLGWNLPLASFMHVRQMDLGRVAREYKAFPLWNSWHQGLDALREQVVMVSIGGWYGVHAAGEFGMARRILSIPGSLVGAGVGPIFTQKIARLHHAKASLRSEFFATARLLAVTILLPTMGMAITAAWLWPGILGGHWAAASGYAMPLSLWVAVAATVSPLSNVPKVVGRQRAFLGWGALYSFVVITSMLITPLLIQTAHLSVVPTACCAIAVLFLAFMWFIRLLEKP